MKAPWAVTELTLTQEWREHMAGAELLTFHRSTKAEGYIWVVCRRYPVYGSTKPLFELRHFVGADTKMTQRFLTEKQAREAFEATVEAHYA